MHKHGMVSAQRAWRQTLGSLPTAHCPTALVWQDKVVWADEPNTEPYTATLPWKYISDPHLTVVRIQSYGSRRISNSLINAMDYPRLGQRKLRMNDPRSFRLSTCTGSSLQLWPPSKLVSFCFPAKWAPSLMSQPPI